MWGVRPVQGHPLTLLGVRPVQGHPLAGSGRSAQGYLAAMRGGIRSAHSHPEDDMKLSSQLGTPGLFFPFSCHEGDGWTCKVEEG